MFQLDEIVHLRSLLESRSSQIKQTNGTPILIGMQKSSNGFKIPNSLFERFLTKS